MRKILTATALGLTLAIALPGAAHASSDGQYWPTATINVDLGNGFKASNETVVRFSDTRGLYEIEDNVMIGRKLDKHVTVWLGYTHDPQYLHGTFTVMEHRIREQVNLDNVVKLGPVNVSGRLRLEQRFRDGVTGTAWRFRPYAKFSLPLGKKSKTNLVLTHESFIDLGTQSFQRVPGEERMRNFVGINTPLVKHVTIEAGYLNQYGFPKNRVSTTDNVMVVSLTGNF